MSRSNTTNALERFSEKCTAWVGSSASLIVHTLLFAAAFAAGFLGISWNTVLLVLTTVVSLEAIYLAILIQISVNRNTRSLEEVEEDIEEIQGDVDEIQEDVDEIAEDIEEIQGDVDEIHDEVDEMSEDTTVDPAKHTDAALKNIEHTLAKLMEEIQTIRNTQSK